MLSTAARRARACGGAHRSRAPIKPKPAISNARAAGSGTAARTAPEKLSASIDRMLKRPAEVFTSRQLPKRQMSTPGTGPK